MPSKNVRTVDLLVGAFDLSQRRKFTIKNDAGEAVLDLYFRPITRADRKRAQAAASSDEALDISTQMLCQSAPRGGAVSHLLAISLTEKFGVEVLLTCSI